MKRAFLLICALALALSGCAPTASRIYDNRGTAVDADSGIFLPGAQWHDTDGALIQAHGGQIQRMPVPDESGAPTEKYVWVGENKRSGHLGNSVAVYTSDDLLHWTCGGDALRSVPTRAALDTDPYFTSLYAGCTGAELDNVYAVLGSDKVIERPKMLYNENTGKYVIWFHSDGFTDKTDYNIYDAGMSGVAISDSPFGPFRLIGRYRLNECPAGQIDCYPLSKGEARDMNLFKDDDGTAYIVYASENNKTLYISKLNEEYTYLSAEPAKAVYGEDYIRLFPGSMREAPVLIKGDNGRYYLMSSSTTGWMSNQARAWSSDSILGKWQNDGNPCKGEAANVTFDTQSTSIFRALNGQWIYYGDRWNGENLEDSRYIWLPIEFKNGRLTIRWQSSWSLS